MIGLQIEDQSNTHDFESYDLIIMLMSNNEEREFQCVVCFLSRTSDWISPTSVIALLQYIYSKW